MNPVDERLDKLLRNFKKIMEEEGAEACYLVVFPPGSKEGKYIRSCTELTSEQITMTMTSLCQDLGIPWQPVVLMINRIIEHQFSVPGGGATA